MQVWAHVSRAEELWPPNLLLTLRMVWHAMASLFLLGLVPLLEINMHLT